MSTASLTPEFWFEDSLCSLNNRLITLLATSSDPHGISQ